MKIHSFYHNFEIQKQKIKNFILDNIFEQIINQFSKNIKCNFNFIICVNMTNIQLVSFLKCRIKFLERN